MQVQSGRGTAIVWCEERAKSVPKSAQIVQSVQSVQTCRVCRAIQNELQAVQNECAFGRRSVQSNASSATVPAFPASQPSGPRSHRPPSLRPQTRRRLFLPSCQRRFMASSVGIAAPQIIALCSYNLLLLQSAALHYEEKLPPHWFRCMRRPAGDRCGSFPSLLGSSQPGWGHRGAAVPLQESTRASARLPNVAMPRAVARGRGFTGDGVHRELLN